MPANSRIAGPFFASAPQLASVGASSRRVRGRRRHPPAPAASSAKRAVPRPRFLTRIAVIEHSSVLFLPCCACSACVRFLPCCACRRRRRRRRRRRCRAYSAAHLLWPRGLSVAAKPESPAGPLNRTRVSFSSCSLRKLVSLDATTTSTTRYGRGASVESSSAKWEQLAFDKAPIRAEGPVRF